MFEQFYPCIYVCVCVCVCIHTLYTHNLFQILFLLFVTAPYKAEIPKNYQCIIFFYKLQIISKI